LLVPVQRFWSRLTRTWKRKSEARRQEQQKWVVEQLINAKSVYLGLQANQEVPPTKKEATRKKPDWRKVEDARKQMLRMIEMHQEALSHPYLFEEYMGLAHVFDKPEGLQVTHGPRARNKISKQPAKEVLHAREERIMAKLEKYAVATGNAELN
jgi:hypothetical protein